MKTTAPTERITCNAINARNDLGRDKLIATITPSGLSLWCMYCERAHVIPRAKIERAWAGMEPRIHKETDCEGA